MRLFVGIALSADLRATLAAEAKNLSEHIRGNFSRPENYHITLAFLGEHAPQEIASIRAAMDAAAHCSRFSVEIGGVGSFRKGNRAIIWQGVKRAPRLEELQGELCKQLRARNIAFDDGKYTPHITLARGCEIASLSDGDESVSARVDVEEITLFESGRVMGALAYTPLYAAKMD